MKKLGRQHYFSAALLVIGIFVVLLHIGIGDTVSECLEASCQQMRDIISQSMLAIVPAFLLPTSIIFFLSTRILRDPAKTMEQHEHARWNNAFAAGLTVFLVLPLISYYPSILIERLATAAFEVIFL